LGAPEPVLEETEAKDHIKDVSNKLKQELAAETSGEIASPSPSLPATDQASKEKTASEIYFDHIISGGKAKKPKPVPNSIISMALSKEKNKEKIGSSDS
jgi:beta-phosphoglucomutase-like phosphatase (HAD superfamily)